MVEEHSSRRELFKKVLVLGPLAAAAALGANGIQTAEAQTIGDPDVTVTGNLTVSGNAGIGAAPPSSDIHFHTHIATDQNFGVVAKNLLSEGVRIASYNDAYNALKGLEIQASPICLNGNAGIGTASPDNRLVVSGGARGGTASGIPDPFGYNASNMLSVYSQNSYAITANIFGAGNGSNWAGGMAFTRSNGSLGGETALQLGDSIANIAFWGSRGASAWACGALLQANPDGNWGTGSAPTELCFFTTPSGSLAGLKRITISNSGNVGIGQTTPAYRLDVAGDINATGVLMVSGTGNSIFPNGSVGIGTPSPQALLHVKNGRIRIEDSATPELDFAVGAIACGQIWTTGGSLCMSPNAASTGVNLYYRDQASALNNGIILDGSGNVGIGTPSPAYKLDVAGDIKLTGDIYLASGRLLRGNAQSALYSS